MKEKDIYYVYMLRCENNSIYTGIAKDYKDRYKKHLEGKGAKYTKVNKPIKIERVWKTIGRSNASKVEHFIKKNSKVNKEKIITNNFNFIEKITKKLLIDLEKKDLN